MSKKGSPAPPPAPDPTVVANAQADANIKTAQEQQKLNMINTSGPQGTVTYAADPNAPGGYSQTTALSPAEQAIFDASTQAQSGALGIANDQLGRVSTALGQGLNPSDVQTTFGQGPAVQTSFNQGPGIQTSYDMGGDIASRFNKGQALQYGFDPGQQVQGQVGSQNVNQSVNQAENAVYQQAASRLDPQFAQSENALRTKLANQGLSQNDSAYQTALQNFNQGKNDAYNQAIYSAIGSGQNEQNTLYGQQLSQGQFANQAAAQQYAQNQGQAAFHNQTSAQDFSQNQQAAQFANAAQLQYDQEHAAAAQFANQAAGQAYGQNQGAAAFGNTAAAQQFAQNQAAAQFGNQAAGQQFQQTAYAQELPINEFNSLMSSGQVAMPTGISYTPSQVNPTDVLGAYALNTQANQAAYNAQAQQNSGLMNGLFSLGSAAIMGSDIGLKTDIQLLRRRADGVGVYAYRYRTDPEGVVRVGVMAQELAEVRPDLVLRRPDGFLAVDYSGLDLEAA